MASKSQISNLTKRIEAIAAARSKSTRVVVVSDDAEMQAVRRREGDRAGAFTFIITGVPRAPGRRSY